MTDFENYSMDYIYFDSSIELDETSGELSKIKVGNRVIEIGSGYGGYLKYLNPTWDLYFGIDLSQFYCKYAKRTAKWLGLECKFVRGSAQYLPFKNNSVDTIISTYTFSDLTSIKWLRVALAEILRIAKPNAQFVFCDITGGTNDNYWKILNIADMARGKPPWGLSDLWIELFSFLNEHAQIHRMKRVKFVYSFSDISDIVERYRALIPAILTNNQVRRAIEERYKKPTLECEGLFLHATIKKD